ncbi:tail protein [Hafnia phage Pocis76]|uniref:Tail protein n=1 Tax=Hafnia phage Pocis76 TaxID=2831174 RepID=A0A8E7FN69_9CAUD|nr:tail protein [Hafnia phage Pocis76]
MHYDLMLAARKELAKGFERQYSIAYENIHFTPPDAGDHWLAYHYTEVDTAYLSLDRRCISYIGMVQVNIVFPPNSGTDRPRMLAKDIANFFYDGKILETGYISEGASVKPVQKSETGWMIPVRFLVRYDEKKEVYNASA